MNKKPLSVAIMGPTASGKTAAALAIARERPVEIISVDSALVYRGMDIGTAKPGPELRAQVPHHLIDIIDPDQSYSAGKWREAAVSVIQDILSRDRIPLVAGGTMLYYRALTAGLDAL
ncbi:MAG TPA: isopentenyl transferase family protein, partial [Telluria sp.]|nr:isopentenyl transferase family protein [Telluria sp.]